MRECLDYDAETGALTWRERPRHHFPRQSDWSRWNNLYAHHQPCPWRDKDGYLSVTIGKVRHRAHRVIWAMQTGAWPKEHIDHRDGDTGNNKWANLREATPTENQRNRKYCASKSGYKGVMITGSQFSDAKRYQAMIMVNRKPLFLGLYATAEEAHEAYKAAAARYFGEFARAR